ncbi:hypothetical protein PVAP13_2KG303704 [Panicum virgatum]|uniref:G-patch domain-containing protein n=1 Tax=Panicum virgatum TaxID=38727 RepID=A0A8T0WBP0_PANVG|nr:hypothetical protein PVAP13_2KG303704 [Panicum virgatum]
MAFKASSPHPTSLFEDLTDDEDEAPMMCLMAKNSKVTSPNTSDDELDNEVEVGKLIKKYGKEAATKMMKLVMKLDEADETLETQEELLRLEREKFKALEKDLAYEREENKMLVNSIKVKDGTLLELKESLSSEKEKVDDLTRKFSFVNDTNTFLRKDNEKLQESMTSLQANHTALEVHFNTLWESTSKTKDTSNSSSPSTSIGCARCFNIDIQTCATNHVEMNAMKKEISRLTHLLQEETPSYTQVPKKIPFTRVGEFEKHTKGFGSRYMSKFGFEVGKGLGRNGQGTPHAIPFTKNKNKTALGAQGCLVNMTTPIHKTNDVIQESGHVNFIKRGTTCDEGAKIVASSFKEDKFKASNPTKIKAQESSHVSFYADYVLTRNHRGKVVAKFVGHRTWNTKVKKHVWVPKVLVTNIKGPKYCWVPKRKE